VTATFIKALMLGNIGNLVQEEVGPHPLLHQGEQVLGREMENISRGPTFEDSVDSKNIPCAALKRRGSWVISTYLWS
jgi:hypothetical protein